MVATSEQSSTTQESLASRFRKFIGGRVKPYPEDTEVGEDQIEGSVWKVGSFPIPEIDVIEGAVLDGIEFFVSDPDPEDGLLHHGINFTSGDERVATIVRLPNHTFRTYDLSSEDWEGTLVPPETVEQIMGDINQAENSGQMVLVSMGGIPA